MFVVGHERQRPFDMLWRHRVDIAVEMHHGRLVYRRWLDQIHRRRRAGQRQQALAFGRQARLDGLVLLRGVGALVGDRVDEGEDVAVALLDADDGAPGQVPRADVADVALDGALLIRLVGGADAQLGVVVAREVEQQGVKAHRIAEALHDDAFGVVEEPLPAASAEKRTGPHQRAQQRVDRRVEDKLSPHRPRPGQHYHEEPQRSLAAGHPHFAHVCPVHLRLFSDERIDAQEGLALRARPHRGHVLAERPLATGVAPRRDHVAQAGRGQARVLLERLFDEVGVRLDLVPLGPPGFLGPLRLLRLQLAQHPLDHVLVQAELRADGPDLPVFHLEEPANLDLDLVRHGHDAPPSAATRRSRCSCRKSPMPRSRRPLRRRAPRSTTCTV